MIFDSFTSHTTTYWLSSAALGLCLLLCHAAGGAWTSIKRSRELSKHPIVNPVWDTGAKERYHKSFASLVAEGCQKFGDRPFRLNGSTGQVLVLPPRYIEEYKSKWELDLAATTLVDFFPSYPGFEMFRSSMAPHDKVLIESVKTHLNPNLGTAIKQLVRETPQAVESAFERPTEWTEAAFSPKILRCVAQMSGVVFLGKAKIDYSAWYKLTSEFVINASRAVVVLREQHPLWRPLIHWFLPECRIIRQQSREARKLIEPAILERLNELSRQDSGEKANEAMVSIDWFTACVQSNHLRNFDFVSAEFTLAIASIRTVSSHVFAGIIRLAMHPEYTARIREEIVAVLKCTAKLDKACLFRMRLLDSFLKESARLNCFPTTLRRMVLEDVRFSDGTLLPQGTYCMVAPPPMKDSACYGPDATEFDGFRYVKLRENAVAKGSSGEQYQYCSVSNRDTIFGLGVHVCPARFFATFQVKILVAYMLLHYDMKLPRGDIGKPLMRTDGYERSIDHDRNLQFMVRQPEIDWQSLMEK